MVSGLSALGPFSGDSLPQHPHKERGAAPQQHLSACRSPEAGVQLQGLSSLREGCGQGRSPPPPGSSPPVPSLLHFLGTSGTLAHQIYTSILFVQD